MKKFFKRGLIALLPAIITIATFYFVFGFLYDHIGARLGEVVMWSVGIAGLDKDGGVYKTIDDWKGILGFVLAIVLTFLTGVMMSTFLGKPLLRLFEWLLKRIPIIKTVYPYAKQFTQFVMGRETKFEFRAPVAIPFPKRGVYSIGFVTGDGMKHLSTATGKRMLTVFVPTAPTPFTGFVLFIPREEAIPLPITTDEALRLIITAGVVTPTHQMGEPGNLGPMPKEGFPLPPQVEKMIQKAQDKKDPT